MVGKLVDLVGGLWVLLSLAWASKLRLRGRYWGWRTKTAFPDGKPPPGGPGMGRLVLEYARWAWRMRRLR